MRLRFPTTEWGRVTAGRTTSDDLLPRYLPALLAFVQRFLNVHPDEAEDLVQGFVERQWLGRDLCAAADRNRGRFRTFLITALKRYVLNQRRARRLSMESGHAIDAQPDDHGIADAVDAFDVAWARQVVSETISRMSEHCATPSRRTTWTVFQRRLLDPIFRHEPPIDYKQLCIELGLDRPEQAANLLVTGKRMYERILREVVADYAGPRADVEEEICDLISIVGCASAESGGEA